MINDTDFGKPKIIIKNIEKRISGCPDIIIRKVFIDQAEGFFVYTEGLIDIDLLNRDFIKPVLSMSIKDLNNEHKIHNLPVAKLSYLHNIELIIADILKGDAVFLCDGMNYAISCSLAKNEKRAIQEPITEKNIKGSHDGFIEDLSINMAMLRKKIRLSSLKFKTIPIDTATGQAVVISYIEGLANMETLDILCTKMKNIKYDKIIDTGTVQQIITDFPLSPFPQYLSTERPDRTVAALLEGRFAIMLDGSPTVLIAPVDYFAFFQSPDDYNFHWISGSALRIVRVFSVLLSIFLPALYVAIVSFHYYAIPLNLINTFTESRSKIPYPPIIEVLILEITIELLREASIRLPTYIGSSIGIVGGLIIGQSAVQAGIVSNLLIIIVAVTAIASYVIPSHDMALAIRLTRYIGIFLSSILGIIGVDILFFFLLGHILILESLGQPYFKPIIPFNKNKIKDTFIILPDYLKKKSEPCKSDAGKRKK